MATKESAPPPLPYDIEIEQAVLGTILRDPAAIDTATAADLESDHFFDPLHQRIFGIMLALTDEGDEISPLIINAVLKMDVGMIEVGGIGYLAGLAQAAPTMPPVKQYAAILKDLAARRTMIEVGLELADRARSPGHENPTAGLLDGASEELARILSGTKQGQRRQPKAATDALSALLRRNETQGLAETPHGAKTGLDPLDDVWGAILPGKLLVAAGRPGMGKSILATNIGRMVADQIPADYLSGEMDEDELASRVGAEVAFDQAIADGLTPLTYGEFSSLRATGGHIARMAEANIRLRELDFQFVFAPGFTLEWVESYCRRRVREKPGHRLVIIDHLQLLDLRDPRRGANRNEIQTEITKRLKALAGELGITILVLSQLSREVEKRDDKHPILSDLREGGSIEQDADIVIGLVRPMVYAKNAITAAKNEEQRHKAIMQYDEAKGVIEVAFLKHRGGRTTEYLKLFVDEKASAIRAEAPIKNEPKGLDFGKLAEQLRGEKAAKNER